MISEINISHDSSAPSSSGKTGAGILCRCGIGLLILLAGLTSACLRTGIEGDCEFPIRLHYSYLHNREGRDLLHEEVPNLSLYLFDIDSERLTATAEYDVSTISEDSILTIMAPPGRYCLVSWGGSGGRYRVSEDATLDGHDCSIGIDGNGDAHHAREHLWHAVDYGIRIDGCLTPVREVEMLKLSNDITVTLKSDDGTPLSKQLSEVEITADNGRYDFSGNIHSLPTAVRYLPASDDSQGHIVHEFTTLSLHENDNSRLKVSYGDTELYSGSLSGLIARQQNIEFGLDDTFDISFIITPGSGDIASVAVSVNGWRVDEYDVTLH